MTCLAQSAARQAPGPAWLALAGFAGDDRYRERAQAVAQARVTEMGGSLARASARAGTAATSAR